MGLREWFLGKSAEVQASEDIAAKVLAAKERFKKLRKDLKEAAGPGLRDCLNKAVEAVRDTSVDDVSKLVLFAPEGHEAEMEKKVNMYADAMQKSAAGQTAFLRVAHEIRKETMRQLPHMRVRFEADLRKIQQRIGLLDTFAGIRLTKYEAGRNLRSKMLPEAFVVNPQISIAARCETLGPDGMRVVAEWRDHLARLKAGFDQRAMIEELETQMVEMLKRRVPVGAR
ncbi:hypothetical protein HY489_02890 [Candidatus Woesearchaeota archaeon]|nr:hypothetical protein [Candidatus Woesearchaeota archaeon]